MDRQQARWVTARTIIIACVAVAATTAIGAAIARWSVSEANGFYMSPVDRYGTPAYARAQPVADSFWQAQDGSAALRNTDDQSIGISTATSTQPAYRSASGS